MADEGKISILTQGSRTSDDSLVTAQDAKMRKELNAYAVMAYVAVSDRNAMAEQLKGLSHLTKAVNELQEKLAEAENKAENLQLEVWRNEAFVTRSRIQLRMKDSEIAGLRKELNKGQSTDDQDIEGDQSGESSKAAKSKPKGEVVEDKEESQGDGAQADEDTAGKKPKSPQPEKSDYLMNRGLQIGVSREIHETVVQENLQLKGHLKRLLADQGASLKDLMDTIQYKEIIKQLKRKIEEKEQEIAKIRATLEQAESPKEQTAKALLDMEEKVKNSERTIKMKQVMIEALSSRIEELTKAVEKMQRRDEIQMAHMRSAFSDGYSSATTADSSVDQVLPSVQIKNLKKENEKLKKLQKHQGSENESLRQERDAAQVEKTEIQRQLATLSQMKFQPCTTCQDLKAAKDRAEEELNITKGELSAAFHQVETYKSDFKERCAEMERTKSGLRSDLDLWKRNFQKLNKQMEHMKNELDTQMKNNSKLLAEKQYFTQAMQQKMGYASDYSASMPVVADQRCGEKVNLWQESTHYGRIRSEIAVGDGPDMPSPQEEASSPQDHQWTTARPSGSRRRPGKLTCMACRREFSPSRQREFEEHQRTCTRNS